jgi:hypothetical protein
LIGEAVRVVPKVVAAEGVVGVFEELEIVGITDKCIGSSLARGSGCSSGISEFLRILFRGEFSGVCSISLKAVQDSPKKHCSFLLAWFLCPNNNSNMQCFLQKLTAPQPTA